jgi:hypothetical protein
MISFYMINKSKLQLQKNIPESKFHVIRYALSNTEISHRVPSYRLRGNCLVFVGNGANPTNQDAIRWFLDELFAAIVTQTKMLKLKIIGNHTHLAHSCLFYRLHVRCRLGRIYASIRRQLLVTVDRNSRPIKSSWKIYVVIDRLISSF